LLRSQTANLLFPAEKQIAARRTKGVVGKTGNAMPTAPKNKHMNPNTVNKIFFINLFQ